MQAGPKHHSKRTERKGNAGGYILIRVYDDDPFVSMRGPSGYCYEHRIVMAAMIGRPLDPVEVVHHVNHDPSDNRPENLMLFPNNGEHLRYHAEVRRKEKAARRCPHVHRYDHARRECEERLAAST